ncbi:MAG: right-handed parallel beta-helix repeat-containing protein [Candidatus Kerfeldbacteria bacterium]|nr:right-handed parallel beta-helix repeat-containing protein [Candidatus Kerfeldbacteria bacterium]
MGRIFSFLYSQIQGYIFRIETRVRDQGNFFLNRFLLSVVLFFAYVVFALTYTVMVLFLPPASVFSMAYTVDPHTGYMHSYTQHRRWHRRVQASALSTIIVIIIIVSTNGIFLVQSPTHAANEPDTPTIIYPSAGLAGIGLNPILVGSTYRSSAFHDSTDWKVTSDSGGSSVVWSQDNDTTDREQVTVATTLTPNTTYYAFVRYTNSNGDSAWSAASAFTTRTERYVDDTGGVDTGSCTSQSSPCLTINYTIDQSSHGDVIMVAAGTYQESVDFDGKSIDINGNGATGNNSSIIDASGNQRAVVFDEGTTLRSKLHGFSIRNAMSDGVAIMSTETTEAGGTVYDCDIVDNNGSGIALVDAQATAFIHDNTIASNGLNGIFADFLQTDSATTQERTIVVDHNKIIGNGTAGTDGSGIRVVGAENYYPISVYIRNNTILANDSDGIDLSENMLQTLDIHNNIIAHNNVNAIDTTSETVTSCDAAYNDIYNNTNGDEDSTECTFSNGITSDPLFTTNASGNTSDLTNTILTDTSTSWTANQFAGSFLFANTTNNSTNRRAWYILSNTATTITVASTSNSYSMLNYETSSNHGDPYVVTNVTLQSLSSARNAGDPSDRYDDDDLSQNDMGFTGGTASVPVPVVAKRNIHSTINELVTFDFSDSIAEGDAKTYVFTQEGSSLTVTNEQTATPSFTPSVIPNYTFHFSVIDHTNTVQSDDSFDVVVFVHNGVTRSGGGGTYDSIAEAVSAASSGETITVPYGVFVEYIDLGSKNLIIDGAGRTGQDTTTLLGLYFTNAPAVIMNDSALTQATVKDMIIGEFGGSCILAGGASSSSIMTVDSVELRSCGQNGIDVGSSSTTIDRSLISAVTGAGISGVDDTAQLIVEDTIIAGNGTAAVDGTFDNCSLSTSVVAGNGSGIACTPGTIENNFVVGNDDYGYLASAMNTSGSIRNNTFLGNRSTESNVGQLTLNDATAAFTVFNNIVAYGDGGGITCVTSNPNVTENYNYSYYNETNFFAATPDCPESGDQSIAIADTNLFEEEASGISTSITADTLTDTSATWTQSEWDMSEAGVPYFLVADATTDITKRHVWMIQQHTGNTLTLYTSTDYELSDFVSSGVSYQILSGNISDESIVVDEGDTANAPATDYFGTGRPRGNGVDMGAYESNGEGENMAPVFSGSVDNISFLAGDTTNTLFNLSDYFSDADGDVLTFSAVGTDVITVDIDDEGNVTMSAPDYFAGSEDIYFRARDPQGASATSNEITVTVSEPDESGAEIDVDHVSGKRKGKGIVYVYNKQNELVASWEAFAIGGVSPRLISVSGAAYIFTVKNKTGTTTHVYSKLGTILKKKRLSPKLHLRKIAVGNLDQTNSTVEVVMGTKRGATIYFKIFSYNTATAKFTLRKLARYFPIHHKKFRIHIQKKRVKLLNKRGQTEFMWTPFPS